MLAKLTALAAAEIILGRTLFAALTLLLVIRAAKRREGTSGNWIPRRFGHLMLLGGLLAIHWFAFFQSVMVSSVAVGLITFSSFPLFTVILEPYFFPIRRRRRDFIYASAILAGVVLVIPQYDLNNSLTSGAAWGLASGLSFAFLQILNRRHVQETPAMELSLAQNSVAFITLLLVFGLPDVSRVTAVDWLLLVLLGTLCTAFAHTLFIRGLDTVSAQTASVITGLEPIYGIAMAMVVLAEIPEPRTLVGGVVVLGAVLCATRDSPPEK